MKAIRSSAFDRDRKVKCTPGTEDKNDDSPSRDVVNRSTAQSFLADRKTPVAETGQVGKEYLDKKPL